MELTNTKRFKRYVRQCSNALHCVIFRAETRVEFSCNGKMEFVTVSLFLLFSGKTISLYWETRSKKLEKDRNNKKLGPIDLRAIQLLTDLNW